MPSPRFQFRISQELLDWIVANGGSKFAREILEKAKLRADGDKPKKEEKTAPAGALVALADVLCPFDHNHGFVDTDFLIALFLLFALGYAFTRYGSSPVLGGRVPRPRGGRVAP